MPNTQLAATTNVCRSEYELYVWSLSAKDLSDTPRKVQVWAEKLHVYLGQVKLHLTIYMVKQCQTASKSKHSSRAPLNIPRCSPSKVK